VVVMTPWKTPFSSANDTSQTLRNVGVLKFEALSTAGPGILWCIEPITPFSTDSFDP